MRLVRWRQGISSRVDFEFWRCGESFVSTAADESFEGRSNTIDSDERHKSSQPTEYVLQPSGLTLLESRKELVEVSFGYIGIVRVTISRVQRLYASVSRNTQSLIYTQDDLETRHHERAKRDLESEQGMVQYANESASGCVFCHIGVRDNNQFGETYTLRQSI